MVRVGLGGPCPHCLFTEPVPLKDLIEGVTIMFSD
jgi:hypothetical protein